MTTLDAMVAKLHEHPLPDGWRTVAVGDVCDGRVPNRDPSGDPDRPFTYIDISSIDTRNKQIVDAKTLLGRDAPSRARQIVRSHDVLVATTRPNLNAVALVPAELDQAIASTGFCVLRSGPEVLPEFLFCFVRCQRFVEALTDLTRGSLYPAVTDGQVRLQRMPIPPLPQQHRIAAALRERLAAVEKARMAAQARLDAAGALPAAKLRSVFEGPDADLWPKKRLGDVIALYKDMVHPGDRESGTAEFVGLEHIESHTGRRIGSLTLDLAKMTGRKPLFRRGQIIYGYLRPYLNKVWIAEFDGCSSVDQFAFDVRADVADSRFIAWFMRSPTFLRRAAIDTTTGQLPRIGTQEIAAVEVGLPPTATQRVVADGLDHWFKTRQHLRDLLEAEADAVGKAPAALLRQALSGAL